MRALSDGTGFPLRTQALSGAELVFCDHDEKAFFVKEDRTDGRVNFASGSVTLPLTVPIIPYSVSRGLLKSSFTAILIVASVLLGGEINAKTSAPNT